MIHLYFTKLDKDSEAFTSPMLTNRKRFLVTSYPVHIFFSIDGEILKRWKPKIYGLPTQEDLDNANYDLAYAKYKERFANAGDFNFYFVGNIDESQLVDFAETYIASLPSNQNKEM